VVDDGICQNQRVVAMVVLLIVALMVARWRCGCPRWTAVVEVVV